ncbi:MAG: MGMT family protein [bacterium]
MENKDFFEKVFDVVRKIPEGKVTTYGYIAQSLGLKSSARMVGWALNSVAGDMSIPCHRVINRNGELTGKRHFSTPNMMRELLESEDIEFEDDRVNLKKHLWVPEIKININD